MPNTNQAPEAVGARLAVRALSTMASAIEAALRALEPGRPWHLAEIDFGRAIELNGGAHWNLTAARDYARDAAAREEERATAAAREAEAERRELAAGEQDNAAPGENLAGAMRH